MRSVWGCDVVDLEKEQEVIWSLVCSFFDVTPLTVPSLVSLCLISWEGPTSVKGFLHETWFKAFMDICPPYP